MDTAITAARMTDAIRETVFSLSFIKQPPKFFVCLRKKNLSQDTTPFYSFGRCPRSPCKKCGKTARETSSKAQTPCSGRCRVLFCVPGGLQAPPDQILQHFDLGAVQRRGDGHRIGFSWLLHRSAHLPSEAGSVVHRIFTSYYSESVNQCQEQRHVAFYNGDIRNIIRHTIGIFLGGYAPVQHEGDETGWQRKNPGTRFP